MSKNYTREITSLFKDFTFCNYLLYYGPTPLLAHSRCEIVTEFKISI